jgi:hypothetical protein
MHRFVPQIANYRLSRTIGAAPVENNCDFGKAQGKRFCGWPNEPGGLAGSQRKKAGARPAFSHA